MAGRQGKPIDLSLLDPKELSSLREQLDGEVQSLTQSAVALQRAAGEFGKSGKAIETLAEQEEGPSLLSVHCSTKTNKAYIRKNLLQIGLMIMHMNMADSHKKAMRLPTTSTGQAMMVPLTSSLYVNGTVTKPREILLDIGTGYFVQVASNSVARFLIGTIIFCRLSCMFSKSSS